MKKFSKIVASMAVLLVGGLAFAGCGTSSNGPISLCTSTYEDSVSLFPYKNAETTKLSYDASTLTYTFSGMASEFTQEQTSGASGYVDSAQQGDAYVVLCFDFAEGTKIKYATEVDIQSDANGTTIKEFENTTTDNIDSNATLTIVKRIASTEKDTIFVVQITKNGTTTNYKLDFSALENFTATE